MKESEKKRLQRAFDSGELDSVSVDTAPDSGAGRYRHALHDIEDILKTGTKVPVPDSFVASVVRRLPSSSVNSRALLLAFYKPVLVLVTVILSILFADSLGIKALGSAAESLLNAASGEAGSHVLYVVVTSSCLLLMLMALVSSFNGIRSRRVER